MRTCLAIGIVWLAAAAAADADVVRLKSGEKVEGLIVSADDQAVVVRWGAGRNTVTRRVRRADIESVAFGPTDVASLRTLARRAESLGDALEAATLWRTVTTLAPDSAGDFLAAARALRLAGRNEEAVTCARRARDLNPDEPRTLLEEGEAALGMGDLRRSAQLALDYLRAAPAGREEGYWLLGRSFERSDRVDDAADAYRKVLEASPKHGGALERLVEIRVARGAVLEAEKLCRDFTAAAPDVRAGWLGLGRALYRQGRTEDAVAAFRKAATLGGPGFDRTRVWLIVARARAEGRKPEVDDADLAVAQELDPNVAGRSKP